MRTRHRRRGGRSRRSCCCGRSRGGGWCCSWIGRGRRCGCGCRCRRGSWTRSRSRSRCLAAWTQPSGCIHDQFPPISTLVAVKAEEGGDPHGGVPTANRPIGDQRRPAGNGRHQSRRAGGKGHPLQKTEVKGCNTSHQWVPPVVKIGTVLTNSSSGCRGVERVVVAGQPSALESGNGKAISAFDYHAAGIDVGGQVVAERCGVNRCAVTG